MPKPKNVRPSLKVLRFRPSLKKLIIDPAERERIMERLAREAAGIPYKQSIEENTVVIEGKVIEAAYGKTLQTSYSEWDGIIGHGSHSTKHNTGLSSTLEFKVANDRGVEKISINGLPPIVKGAFVKAYLHAASRVPHQSHMDDEDRGYKSRSLEKEERAYKVELYSDEKLEDLIAVYES